MLENDYKTNECDKCIFHKTCEIAHVLIRLYVDDLLIFGSNLHIINETKNMLNSHFDMKDLGEANLFCELKLPRQRMVFFLISCITLRKFLKKYNF